MVSHLLTSAMTITVTDITKTTMRRWLIAGHCKTLDVEHLVQHSAVPSPSTELSDDLRTRKDGHANSIFRTGPLPRAEVLRWLIVSESIAGT